MKPKSNQKKIVKGWVYEADLTYKNFMVSKTPDEYGQQIEIKISYVLPIKAKKK